tara:strand:- start:562 stop:861 length:300 start_codon:yes stop_codon:yes gene_type:complete
MMIDIDIFIDTLIIGTVNSLEKREIHINNEQEINLRKALSEELKQEFELQSKTPTQVINNFIKNEFQINSNLTPNDFGDEAKELIIMWGLSKAKKFDEK